MKRKKQTNPLTYRRPRFESLEIRDLLSVAAGCDSADFTSSAETVQLTAESPAVPVILTGSGGHLAAAGKERQQICWTSSENAVRYILDYSSNGTEWSSIYTTETSAFITGLSEGSTMRYRVRAAAQDSSMSAWSSTKSFLVCSLDVDGDGFIGPGDQSFLSGAWFTAEGDEAWNPACDIDRDGFIGPGDRSFLSGAWFKNALDVVVPSLTLKYKGKSVIIENDGTSSKPALRAGDIITYKAGSDTEYSNPQTIEADTSTFTVKSFQTPGPQTVWVKVTRPGVSSSWFSSITFTVVEDLNNVVMTNDGAVILLTNIDSSASSALKAGDLVSYKTRESASYGSTQAVRKNTNSFTVLTLEGPGTYSVWVKVSRTGVDDWYDQIQVTVPDFKAGDGLPQPSPVTNPAVLEITGNWDVRVTYRGKTQTFNITPQETLKVSNEYYTSLPVFNSSGYAWLSGQIFRQLAAMEAAVQNELISGSVTVRLTPDGTPLTEGVDYKVDYTDSTIGRIEGGKIGASTPVYITYSYMPLRIDSIILTADGELALLTGDSHVANPVQPALQAGEERVANIFLSGKLKKLTEETLYPILDDGAFAEPSYCTAKWLLPKVWSKLIHGETVTILAWGDSVTDGSYLPSSERWQQQFIKELRSLFPQASIRLITEAWGGKNTSDYLNASSTSEHNFQKVLDAKPDLVISEFVNDTSLSTSKIQSNYSRIKSSFDAIGAEWIICTPHYVRQSWMGLTSQKNIDSDPRNYTPLIRSFAEENAVPIADAAALYGRLWRQGIPYQTYMANDANHPNADGMYLYVRALMGLFTGGDLDD